MHDDIELGCLPKKRSFHNLATADSTGMTKVSKSQILGNRAEHLVSYLLSQFCLVRPVANGTDIGVDLFCEAISEDGHSAGHFWVQVKSKAKPTRKIKLDRGHVDYWIRQPVPVFIFIICESQNSDASNFEIHSINLIEQLIKNSNFRGKFRTFHSDETMSSNSQLEQFVRQTVPVTIARQKLTDGQIVPIKYNGVEGYVKKYATADSLKFIPKILKNIGRTSSLLAREILNNDKEQAFNQKLDQLEMILEAFAEARNYDMPYTLGMLQQRAGKYDKAIVNYERARDLLSTDCNPEIPAFGRTINNADLTLRIEFCKKQLNKSSQKR